MGHLTALGALALLLIALLEPAMVFPDDPGDTPTPDLIEASASSPVWPARAGRLAVTRVGAGHERTLP